MRKADASFTASTSQGLYEYLQAYTLTGTRRNKAIRVAASHRKRLGFFLLSSSKGWAGLSIRSALLISPALFAYEISCRSSIDRVSSSSAPTRFPNHPLHWNLLHILILHTLPPRKQWYADPPASPVKGQRQSRVPPSTT